MELRDEVGLVVERRIVDLTVAVPALGAEQPERRAQGRRTAARYAYGAKRRGRRVDLVAAQLRLVAQRQGRRDAVLQPGAEDADVLVEAIVGVAVEAIRRRVDRLRHRPRPVLRDQRKAVIGNLAVLLQQRRQGDFRWSADAKAQRRRYAYAPGFDK